MRRIVSVLLVVMAALGTAAPWALAGPNAGGTLIVHYPDLSYTADTADYCGLAPLSSCVNAVSEIDGSGPSAVKVWKVYAAFVGGSSPRLKGVSFGITYSGNLTIPAQEYGTCGDVEFPDNTWPRSGTGNSVIWDNPQTTILVECYWFAGYVTGGAGTFTLGPNPSLGGDFTDDSIPPKVDPIDAYGTMGFSTAGNDPCPVVLPTGACCFKDGTCQILTQTNCASQGGTYLGDNTSCDPNPCPQPTGACCFNDGTCQVLTKANCLSQGGTYQGDKTTCTPNPCTGPTGACCFADGSCQVLTRTGCTAQGGTYEGDNTTCTPNPCPQPIGACCFKDGTCQLLRPAACLQAGGTWQGPNTVCNPNPCTQLQGACCFPDGTCQLLNRAECSQAGGSWQGPNTVCSPNPCPQLGACCANGTCTITLQAGCSGQWMGSNTVCNPNPCPPSGACCVSGACTITTQSACSGQWMGANTTCTPNPCPQPEGACCFKDGTCQLLTQAACTQAGGTWQGMNTVCSPNPCPQPGACCQSDGSCTVTLQSACTGTWLGTGTTCSPNPCPQPGACCQPDGSCTVTLQSACTGNWLGAGTSCTPNPCPQPPAGACCINGVCTITTQANCSGQWMGANTTCNPNPCPPAGACCVNGVCTITTQANCPGQWMGANTGCTPNPCPQPPTGACCICGQCTITTQTDCQGQWMGAGTTCNPNPCPVVKRYTGRGLAHSGRTARSVGVGHGKIKAGPRTNPCSGSTLLLNADGSYENGFTWWYGGEVAPYYGAFAEGYDATGSCCGQQWAITTESGMYQGQKADAYIWNSDGCNPTSVINVDYGLSVSTPAIWPSFTLADINTTDEVLAGNFFVGYWGEWPGAIAGWFIGADLDGFGGMPRTNIAPGIGYPTGWSNVSVIWGPTQAIGIGAYILTGPPPPVPVSIQTWGRIKSLYH